VNFRCLLSLKLKSFIICQDMPTESGMGHSLYQLARMRLAQTNSSCHRMTVFDFLNCRRSRYSSADAGNNTLHGGLKGYDRRVWKLQNSSLNSATFVLIDPAGNEGFPGTVSTTVSYSDSSKFN
jgi:hypothetical protein